MGEGLIILLIILNEEDIFLRIGWSKNNGRCTKSSG